MKNIFLLSAFVFVLPFTTQASELIKATSFKVKSADGLTDVSTLKVQYGVICKYKAGIFWPESKSCGTKTLDINIEQDGTVKLPSIEKFDGLHGKKEANYDASISFYDGKNWLGSISSSIAPVSKMNFDGKTLSIYRLNAATIKVSNNGSDFFGSDLSQVDRASLSLTINPEQRDALDQPGLVSPLTGTSLWWRENFKSYEGKEILKDEKEISLKETSYISFKNPTEEKLILNLRYTQLKNYTYETVLKVEQELKLSPDALTSIDTLELK